MMSCGGKPTFCDEQIVGALADLDAALEGVRLAALVECHHHHGRAVTADEFRLVQKLLLAFLEADGIDDALALKTFQPGLDDLPLRGIHHHRAPWQMSGSEATRFRKRVIAATPSIIPSSMQTSMTCAPFSTCWRAMVSAAS